VGLATHRRNVGCIRSMSIYRPIHDFLSRQTAPEIVLTFTELARLLGRQLPQSAFEHDAWWQDPATHSQAQAWHEAGYRASPKRVDKIVSFRRLG
jgi:hypothetical protein